MVPGVQLEQLIRTGRRDIILVAPFVKARTLSRLLDRVSENVVVRCVTRWRPEEIIAGVSDLEIWPLLRDRPEASLWLRPDLHAKYYRADDVCLIGSANITDTALGWASQANFELLVSLPLDYANLDLFEATLFSRSIQVDESLYQQMMAVVQLLYESQEQSPITKHDNPAVHDAHALNLTFIDDHWLPSLRQPADLYIAYAGRWDELTTAARHFAAMDIQALAIPTGLSRKVFNVYIGILLLQKPLIREIDAFLAEARRFGEVRDFISVLIQVDDEELDPSRAWQTVMRWLLYFLPKRYTRIPSRHSEVLQRILL
jgi:hypothetical protein